MLLCGTFYLSHLVNVPALTIKAKEDRPLSIWARVAAGLIAVKQYVQKFVR